MIRLVDEKSLGDLQTFCLQKEIDACRIACLLESYGLGYDFVRFWLQYDLAEKPTAAIVNYEGSVTAALTDDCNRQELREFLRVIGWSTLSSRAELLPGQEKPGILMRLTTPAAAPDLPAETVVSDHPSLRDVYELLNSCRDELSVPPYESFLLDLSHKLRHGTARCCTLEYHKQTVACAMTVALSPTCAVIGAVAVDKNYRRRGFGRCCVQTLCSRLGERTVLLLREPHKNRAFYEALGFRNDEMPITKES